MDKNRSIFMVNFFDHIQGKGHVIMGFSHCSGPPHLKAELSSVCISMSLSLGTHLPMPFPGVKLRKSIIMKMLLFFYPSTKKKIIHLYIWSSPSLTT